MFTGIITDIGKVRSVEQRGDTRFEITSSYAADDINVGASIACAGVCLTVVDKGQEADGDWFAVDVSAETLSLTSLTAWQKGSRVNLERSLKVGDELGGHIVSGHVDGVATILTIEPDGDSRRFAFEAPAGFSRYVAQKGSVALNGVSLTVNNVDGAKFGINIIPHTQSVTTFGDSEVGDQINFEIDVLARYVARLADDS